MINPKLTKLTKLPELAPPSPKKGLKGLNKSSASSTSETLTQRTALRNVLFYFILFIVGFRVQNQCIKSRLRDIGVMGLGIGFIMQDVGFDV